jgi:hypothetical protein
MRANRVTAPSVPANLAIVCRAGRRLERRPALVVMIGAACTRSSLPQARPRSLQVTIDTLLLSCRDPDVHSNDDMKMAHTGVSLAGKLELADTGHDRGWGCTRLREGVSATWNGHPFEFITRGERRGCSGLFDSDCNAASRPRSRRVTWPSCRKGRSIS